MCDPCNRCKSWPSQKSQKELAKTRLLKLSKTTRIVTAFSRHKTESQMVTIFTVWCPLGLYSVWFWSYLCDHLSKSILLILTNDRRSKIKIIQRIKFVEPKREFFMKFFKQGKKSDVMRFELFEAVTRPALECSGHIFVNI
jgi:hypothetical protein